MGTSAAADSSAMWASISSRATAPSPCPRDQAKPALVVARALKPMLCRYLTVPMSQGLGMTKHPLACSLRKAVRFSAVVGMAGLLWVAGTIVRLDLRFNHNCGGPADDAA